jgi:hypothetical protein
MGGALQRKLRRSNPAQLLQARCALARWGSRNAVDEPLHRVIDYRLRRRR